MTTIKGILTLLLFGALTFFCACGGGSTSGSTSSSLTSGGVSIALNPPLSSTTVMVGNTLKITPVVTNDPNNLGVDWAVTCSLPSGACGTLNLPLVPGSGSTTLMHSASGTAVTYTPPANFLTGSLAVNVTVYATADHTKNVATALTVASYTSVLKGNYVFQVQGSDGTYPYQAAGVLTLDGNGNITAAEEIYNTETNFSLPMTLQNSSSTSATPGVASTYYIGPDGRGTINLNVQQTNDSANTLTQQFSLVVLSASKATIADLGDTNSLFAGAVGIFGSGTLELQNATAASAMPSGPWAFVTSGMDFEQLGTPIPTAMGGVINIDNNPSPGAISGAGSLADQDYYNTKNVPALLSCPPGGLTGTVGAPDPMGAVAIALTGSSCFGFLQYPATVQFNGYVVDSTHIRLIETDDSAGVSGFLTSGIAVAQGSSAGSFTNASLSGPYVFDAIGIDEFSAAPDSLTIAGTLTSGADGTFTTGITDSIYPGADYVFTAAPLSGTYTLDSNTPVIGRAQLSLKYKAASPVPHPHVFWYLAGDGTALLLYAGGEDANMPAIGIGTAYPQSGALAFGNPENYGVGFTQGLNLLSGTAAMNASATVDQGTITGTLDDVLNNNFLAATGTGPLPLQDSFTLPADQFGRIPGTFFNGELSSSGLTGPAVEYYLIDQNDGLFVENDFSNSTQVMLGTFNQACDVTSATSCATAASKSSRRLVPRRANSHAQLTRATSAEGRAH